MADETKSLTEEQMLDFFQKEGIAHEQRGGKLFVADRTGLPGKYGAYFNEEGFFVDAGKEAVASEVRETIAEEGLNSKPAPGDEPESKTGAESTAEVKTPTKTAAKKAASKKGK